MYVYILINYIDSNLSAVVCITITIYKLKIPKNYILFIIQYIYFRFNN